MSGSPHFTHASRSPDLLKGIYDMGFSKPSKIQERALPLMLSNPYVAASYLTTANSRRLMQCNKHDRPIAVGHRKDGCIRAHYA